jgi:glutaredoxin
LRRVTLFVASGCHLCDAAREVIESVRPSVPFELEIVAIDDDIELERRYRIDIPVVEIDGTQAFRHFVDADELRRILD